MRAALRSHQESFFGQWMVVKVDPTHQGIETVSATNGTSSSYPTPQGFSGTIAEEKEERLRPRSQGGSEQNSFFYMIAALNW